VVYNYYYNGLFSRTTWVSRHQKGKPFWILLEHEMMGWQCHQLDHMQIICTSLQTDNHTSTEYLNTQFLQAGCPSCRPTNWWSIKLDYYYYYNYSIKRGGERTWLAVSAREWMNSENMLCEPVYNHAIHFIIQLVALLQITTAQQLIQQMPYFLTIYRRKKRLLVLLGHRNSSSYETWLLS